MTPTELGYLSGVTSNIQDQLNGKALSGHTHYSQGIEPTNIELNTDGRLDGYGGFIDFHFNGSQEDYTSRIIENDSGYLRIFSPNGFQIIGTAGTYMTANSLGSVWFSNLCVDNNFGDTLPEAKGWGQIYFLKA